MERRQFMSLIVAGATAGMAASVARDGATADRAGEETVAARRLSSQPIIVPGMETRMGSNINGPSLIATPAWLPGRLGRYYLYFAHHAGSYIRMAYADDLRGPWRIHAPGVLDLEDSFFVHHIASPEVRVDHGRRQIRLFYHGKVDDARPTQMTRVALSADGLTFAAKPAIILDWYARLFTWDGMHYALTMPGSIWRSADGLSGFERGPLLFGPNMRHSAVLVRGHTLFVFYTNVGDLPERILLSRIDLRAHWRDWRETPPVTILRPEMEYEGARLPLSSSARGHIFERAHQLRDPAVYVEGERTYLLYAVAGESGIAIAELSFIEPAVQALVPGMDQKHHRATRTT